MRMFCCELIVSARSRRSSQEIRFHFYRRHNRTYIPLIMNSMFFSWIRRRKTKETYSILEGSGSAKDIILNSLEERESILRLGLEVSRRIEVLDVFLEFLQVAIYQKHMK
jgi:hypothetical protein